MKEIIAVIRPNKVGATKEALVELGLPSMTAIPVLGRGRQKGIETEVDVEYRPGMLEGKHPGMKYIPKRYLSIVVTDADADKVVEVIMKVNHTGQIGDGKVFICPAEEAIRIRTDETGDSAIY